GQSSTTRDSEAWLWNPETGIVGLGDLPGGLFGSNAWDVNDLSHVSGAAWAGYPRTVTEAFIWTPALGMVGLGDLRGGDFYSLAYAINNLDQVVGISWSSNGFEAFMWDAQNGMVGLGDLPGGQFSSIAHDINDLGHVVGGSFSDEGLEAFLWTPETGMVGLGPLEPGESSYAYGINNLDQIVGCSAGQGFLWDPVLETMTGLPYLDGPAPIAWAYDINDRGEIVGVATPDHLYGYDYATTWDGEQGLRVLDDLLDASSRQRTVWLTYAEAINNFGQIAAYDEFVQEAVLLTPVLLGDLNCDRVVNLFDVEGFVLALLDRPAYRAAYPDCRHEGWAADVNQDALINNFDIEPFIELLLGG
ncbi:MAG: hypothetical protein ACREUU_07365, partial [Gammaproteobacteria bacterium]